MGVNIGVIFLLFSLGLEFSFKKIVKMGAAPIIAAVTIMFCMMMVGIVVGHSFGMASNGLHLPRWYDCDEQYYHYL